MPLREARLLAPGARCPCAPLLAAVARPQVRWGGAGIAGKRIMFLTCVINSWARQVPHTATVTEPVLNIYDDPFCTGARRRNFMTTLDVCHYEV